MPCRPQGKDEIQSLECKTVEKNPYCSNNQTGETCQRLAVSTIKSYVRISPRALESNYDLLMSICAQKPLDGKLQQVLQNTDKSFQGWAFFGSVDGFLYVYPGRDYDDDNQCSQYDPRRRPWYINALAMVKSLYIMIDTSSSMNNVVGPLSSQSCLDVARGILGELLNTLTTQDRVAVSTISGAAIGTPVSVSLAGTETSQNQPEIRTLKDAINKLKTQDLPTDLKQGLTGALRFFNSSSDLKVLLILSDGRFATSLNLSDLATVFSQLRDENVAIFFYRIGYENVATDGTLQQMQLSLNMTLEEVKDADNPLFKIRSYFDYLAWLRFLKVNKIPTWVPLYNDGAGLGDVTTSIVPAFDSNRRLIGVAAIDVLANKMISELGLSVVQEAISKRSPLPSHQQAFVPPQPPINDSVNCPRAKLTPVCPKKDANMPLKDFICCGTCSKGSSSSSQSSRKIVIIVGSSVGAVIIGVIIIAALLFTNCYNRKEGEEGETSTEHQEIWAIPKKDAEVTHTAEE